MLLLKLILTLALVRSNVSQLRLNGHQNIDTSADLSQYKGQYYPEENMELYNGKKNTLTEWIV